MSQQPPHTPGPGKVEKQEKYLIHSQTAIRQVLGEISKKPDLVTAYFNGDEGHLITVVLAVLPERNLLVFDRGPDEAQNRRLLELGQMTCVTRHKEILIRFTVREVKSARYQGQHVFAAPIPEELLRLQRREYFRVHTPVLNPVLCRIPQTAGGSFHLPLTDISVGGTGMLDKSMQFESQAGDILKNCVLIYPDNQGQFDVDLQVRSVFATGTEQPNPMLRIGAAFLNLSMDQTAFIQRYIHRLQVEQSAMLRE